MPKFMQRFLGSKELNTHLLMALIVGFLLRTLSAYFVYGPQALDDYKHGVYPAYQFFANLPLEIPEYRSHLLIWILAFFTKVGSFFGASSALSQVRCMYFGLGVLSLFGIYGTYLYVRNFRSKYFAPLAIYLVAAHGLMPFLSTRAFGEALALPFVLLGFGILEDQRLRKQYGIMVFLGFLIFGFACLLRFQAGILMVGYFCCLMYMKEWRFLLWGLAAGLISLAMQAGVDLASGKQALSTLFIYLGENSGGGAKYGVSPWYNTWLFVLFLTLFPFSIVFVSYLKPVWKSHWPLIVCTLLFVGIHSLVAHKEERFLYPIVGFVWIFLAALWSQASADKWARKIYAPIFIFINTTVLLVTCFVNTQEGEIEPAAYAEKKFGKVLYLDDESVFGRSKFLFYFLRSPSHIEKIKVEEIQASKVDEALEKNPEVDAVMFLTSKIENLNTLSIMENVATAHARCEKLRTAQSLGDRVLYGLNPKHNQRRKPTWYIICGKTEKPV